jgi:hypothetical protein
VLYSRKGENRFGCVKCNRPAYGSNCWPYTGRRNARGISLLERERLKQEQAAKQISEQLSGDGEDLIIGNKIDKDRKIKKPKNMSQTRFEDLMYLFSIKKQFALIASLRVAQYLLSKAARN